MASFRPWSGSSQHHPAEVTLVLDTVDQLFNGPAHLNMLAGEVEGATFITTGRLISGMEELILELTPHRVRGGVRLNLVLPEEEIEPETHDAVSQAIIRYCELRLRQTQLELENQRREGFTALRIGSVLFFLGIALSYVLTRNSIPDTVQAVLGNGVFLLIAWLGLWYPLDLLVFLRRPLVKRKRVLRALESVDLRLSAAEPPFSPARPAESPAGQAEHPLGDDVALDLARPPGDRPGE